MSSLKMNGVSKYLRKRKTSFFPVASTVFVNESGSLLKQVMNLNYDISFHLFIV